MDDDVWSSEEEELNFGGTLGIGSASAVAGLIKSATIVEREQRSALPYQVSINHFEKRAMICVDFAFKLFFSLQLMLILLVSVCS